MTNTELKPLNDQGLTPIGEIYMENGKPYRDFKGSCPRCGGLGIIVSYVLNGHLVPVQPDAGVCYKCWGEKTITKSMRVYTEKEIESYKKRQEKIKEKKQAEWEATKAERIKKDNEQMKRNRGFWKDSIFVVAIEKCYSLKDELKEQGARWNQFLTRWYFEDEALKDKYPLYEVKYEDVVTPNEFGGFDTDFEGIKALNLTMNKYEKHFYGIKISDKYYGSMGDKIQVKVKVEDIYSFSSEFNYHTVRTTVYKMRIIDSGELLVWKTSSGYLDLDNTCTCTIKGTIKEHSEYNGEKQTVLIRCKEVK